MAEPDPRLTAFLDGGPAGDLAQALRADPELRRQYWHEAQFRAALREGLAEHAGTRAARPPLRWWPLALAAGLLLAIGAWLAWPTATVVIDAGSHRLALGPRTRLVPEGDRAWRLEHGRVTVTGSGPLRIRTPHLLAEALGTDFDVAVEHDATAIQVASGTVLLHADGDEVEVGAGATARRATTWQLDRARRWHPIFSLDAATVKEGRRASIDGQAVVSTDPVLVLRRGDQPRQDLPATALIDVTYHLTAEAAARQPPILGLHRYQEGQGIHYLIAPLPHLEAGWHRARLPVASFRSSGDRQAPGWIETVMVSQAPMTVSLAAVRVLVPVTP